MKRLSGGELAAILSIVGSAGYEDIATETLISWDFPIEFDELRRKYATWPDLSYDPTLATWLVSRCGAGDPAEFEAELQNTVPGLWAPLWVLSTTCERLTSRLPARPLASGVLSDDLQEAYDGLLSFIDHAGTDFLCELQRTATIWRVAALADGIEPADETRQDSEALGLRIDRIKARVRTNPRMNALDSHRFGNWDTRSFGDRRNALTHLGGRSISFAAAADFYSEPRAVLDECSTISLAVLELASSYMEELPPPKGILNDMSGTIAWIDT